MPVERTAVDVAAELMENSIVAESPEGEQAGVAESPTRKYALAMTMEPSSFGIHAQLIYAGCYQWARCLQMYAWTLQRTTGRVARACRAACSTQTGC